MTQKQCRKCGQVKPADQFWKRAAMKDGLRNECKTCSTSATKRWRETNPEQAKILHQRYYDNNREQIRERRSTSSARAQSAARQRLSRQRRREQVLDHYGRTCACCGSADQLTIDHVNGGGTRHRRETGIWTGGHRMNAWLVTNGFPAGFQVLCLSCNASKRDSPTCRIRH